MSYIAFPTITVCHFMIIMKIQSNYSDYNVFQTPLGKAEIEYNYLYNISELYRELTNFFL